MAHPIQTINPPEIIKRVGSLLAVTRITQLQQQPLGTQPLGSMLAFGSMNLVFGTQLGKQPYRTRLFGSTR